MIKTSTAFFVLFCFCSCSVEQVSKSPMNYVFEQTNSLHVSDVSKLSQDLKINAEIAKITNTLASISYVKDKTINKEIDALRIAVQNFIYAYREQNIEQQNRYLKNIQNSYRKIYSAKSRMNEDEFMMLNHFLVKIKGSIAQLDSTPILISD